MTRTLTGVSLLFLATGAVFADSTPAFEVASIKPSAPMTGGRMMIRMGGDPGRINYNNVSLKDVLARAYSVKRFQISGPGWLDSERFDITAKLPDGVSQDKVPAMLQALLTERFKIKLRKESKEQSVYAMVVGKNGIKLKKSEEPDPAPPAGPGAGPGLGPNRSMIMMSGNGRLEIKKSTIGNFCDALANFIDRPVVDKTEVEGRYDFTLELSMEDMAGMRRLAGAHGMPAAGASPHGENAPAPEAAPSASIFTAVQQLGLKLEPRKALMDLVVIDSAEKVPTEN